MVQATEAASAASAEYCTKNERTSTHEPARLVDSRDRFGCWSTRNLSGRRRRCPLINAFVLDFVARHKEQPFLLYYPMLLTHAPFQPTPDSPDWDPKVVRETVHRNVKHFADMIAYMDKLVGRLIDKLDSVGLGNNTLVIFLGDNGTEAGVPSVVGGHVVTGGKGLSTDTGTHVSLIAHWPGHVPAGRVCDDLVDSTDILPTICDAAGISVPSALNIDGQSVYPQLCGQKGQPRQWIYSWFARDGGPVASREFAANKCYKLYRTGELFDLRKDIAEVRPLSARALGSEAAIAKNMLQGVRDRFKDTRCAKCPSRPK
jgi:arylsulfatase A